MEIAQFLLERVMKVSAMITHNWSRRNSAWAPFTLITYHQFLVAESSSQLSRISAAQCLKFCYNTSSFAMLSTLNNPESR